MFAVITYDIPTDNEGKKRYTKIHKLCSRHGYCVNNSVFEFDMGYSDFLRLRHDIEKVIDVNQDSVRIYVLGKQRTEKNVLCLGKTANVEINDLTVF